MSKLKVVVKKDGKTPSTIRVAGLRSVWVRPTPRSRWASPKAIYVTTCEVHNDLTPTVPVDTVEWDSVKRVPIDLGVRRYCIFCWTPIEKAP